MIKNLETQIRYYPQVHIDVHRTDDDELIETATYSGESYHKTIVAVTTQIGCVAKCDFCLVGNYGFKRNLDAEEHLQQVKAVVENPTGIPWLDTNKKIKVSLCRAGESLLNPHTPEALEKIAEAYSTSFQMASIMPDKPLLDRTLGEIASFVKRYEGTFQLIVSMHATDEEKRKEMVSYPSLMDFKQIAEVGEWWVKHTNNERRVSLSFAMMEDNEIDLKKIKSLFSPEYFAIRLGFYLPTTSRNAALHPSSGMLQLKAKKKEAEDLGYLCITSLAKGIEQDWDCRSYSGLKLSRASYMNMGQRPSLF